MQTGKTIMQLFLQHTTVTMKMGQLEGMADPLPTQLILLISVKIDPVVEGRGNEPFESLADKDPAEFSFFREGLPRRERLCEEDERETGRRKRDLLPLSGRPGESEGSGSL